MLRLFGCLVFGNLLLSLAAAAVGLLGEGSPNADRHVLLGVGAVLWTCFNQVVVFTYFTVTGKVLAQAVHLAKLDPIPLARAGAAKRVVTRWLAVVVVAAIPVVVLGAIRWRQRDPMHLHAVTAMLMTALNLWVCVRQSRYIHENARLCETVLKAYQTRGKPDSSGESS